MKLSEVLKKIDDWFIGEKCPYFIWFWYIETKMLYWDFRYYKNERQVKLVEGLGFTPYQPLWKSILKSLFPKWCPKEIKS